ncbi:MAG: flavin reductase family protein [Bacteroidetes bacterium]|jgi:flavin reductase (DIM6/NTAB) family NADH-FMN oxidoreductase RutF|nr:flavin reductase family protein [Bacteroidota bacterium]
MLTINTSDISPLELQGYLQSAIAPRPICLASTIDKEGQVNLSPFSYFNLFSMNPPICIFSPSRRVRDNTTKHTLENLKEVPECVINIVNYAMVQQVSLSSCEYPKNINEFTKAGFTQIPSDLVAPPRVAESPIQLECTVAQIIALGEKAGAGNLVLAEIKKIHITESVLNANNKIDQAKLDLVARLGGDWYARINEQNLFEVTKPNTQLGMGFDMLPKFIKDLAGLTNNEKAQLANCTTLPAPFAKNADTQVNLTPASIEAIKLELANNNAQSAWTIIEKSV